MGVASHKGFTMIEVMLFLAVTGMLMVAILVGSGVAIGQQRYRDSVSSLQSYLQQQYNLVTDVSNARDQGWTCDSSGNVIAADPSVGTPRGTSDCVIMGRFITIDSTGTQVVTSNVVGYRAPGAQTQPSDIDEITKNYKLGISPINQDSQTVSWSAQVVKPKTVVPQPLSILILSSPLSGSILTFVESGDQSDLNGMVAASNMSTQYDLCVNAEVGSFVGKRMEVRIAPYATSASAIQVPVETDSICD